MLDDMFSFIHPVIDLDEGGFSEFIVQMDAFFGRMEQSGGAPLKVKRPLTEETYKEMWMLRYQQHLGQITFLELLDKYEKILGIPPLSKSDE